MGQDACEDNSELEPTVTGPADDQDTLEGQPFPRIEGYEVTGRLGQGGMGTVWRAVQLSTHREVALKLLGSGSFATDKQRHRFEREVELASNLEHPNVARIYESGLHRGVYYYAMALIDGLPLDEYVEERKPSQREVLELMAKVCRAVQHAHQRGIIHRDLKPSNILVTKDGQPHVLDFGLAKTLREPEESVTVSLDGDVAGTPAYMSPEQASGRLHEIDTRSDVYGLGVMLYRLLVGQPPHDQSGGRLEVLRRVATEEVRRPRELNRRIDRELEALLLKALSRDVGRRYASAGELAQDIGNYLKGDPLDAHRPTVFYFLCKRLSKYRRAVAVGLAIFIVAVAGLLGVLHYARAVARAREIAALKSTLESGLASGEWSAVSLASMEGVVDQLAELSPAEAAAARARLYDGLAAFIRTLLQRPVLAPADVSGIEGAIQLLAERNPDAAPALRSALEERLRVWQPIFQLEAPFGELADVFDPASVHADGDVLVRSRPNKDDKTKLILTRVPCRGEVQLEAVFAERWDKATQLGVVLNGAEKRGYELKLSTHTRWLAAPTQEAVVFAPTFAEAKEAGEFLRVQIRRHQVTIRDMEVSAVKFGKGPLRMVAKREGHRLTFQINELPPVVYREVFPLSRLEQGVFGVCWDEDASLVRLQATGLARSAAPSALEEGDELYAAGDLVKALECYRRQAVVASDLAFRQEARYKEGLCLVGLKQDDEAEEVFRRLSTESGDRWVVAGACQLWLRHLRQGRLEEADRLFVYLTVRYPYGKLAELIPYDLGQRIIADYCGRAAGTRLVRLDPDRVRNLQRVVAVQGLLDVSPRVRLQTRRVLMRAYELDGDRQQALRIAKELITSSVAADYMTSTLSCEDYVWMMCVDRRFREGLTEVDRLLAEKPEHGSRYAARLYVERACLHARMEKWDEAERDLKDYFRSSQPEQRFYVTVTRAHLLRGFLRERRGDQKGALEAWRAGRAVGPPSEQPYGPFAVSHPRAYGQDYLHYIMTSSLAHEMSNADVERVLGETFFSGGEEFPRALLDGVGGTLAPVMCEMWCTPRGREYARKIIFREVPFYDAMRLPAVLLACEYVKQHAFDGKASAEQDGIVLKLAEDVFDAFFRGKLGNTDLVRGVFAWKGATEFLGWGGLKDTLDPAIRGPAAYVMGFRCLRLARPEDAVTFFAAAKADAPAGSVLRRLAETELARLAKEKASR